MTWADIGILAVISVSALVSVVRGFLREVLSLLAWVAAFWVAFAFTDRAAAWFEGAVTVPSGRSVLGFVTRFVGTLLAVGVVNFVIARLVDKTGLSGTDRLLGLLFGLARGLVVVTVLVLVAGLLRVPAAPWWQGSTLIQPFEGFALWTIAHMPPDLAAQFHY
ncbi:MAG: CvpA family protein [Gammaproteobacteria bacterium]|nr:CvpA family protein [Gammaproteobacteria bacterium]